MARVRAVFDFRATSLGETGVQVFRRAISRDGALYPTPMRVILMLSILSWMPVALAIAWVVRT